MPDDFLSSREVKKEERRSFTDFVYGNRINIFLLLMGFILIGSGILLFKNTGKANDIEIIENTGKKSDEKDIVVEIAGAVEKQGVYRLSQGSRVEDLLITSGGLSADADRGWVEKYVNRAAKLSDGQKFYIPKENEQSIDTSANIFGGNNDLVLGNEDTQNKPININIGSQSDLESLPGIGPVYAQSIIEHRPYSSVEELLSKGAIKSSVYEKVKEMVTVY